jgi:hypothetical protein
VQNSAVEQELMTKKKQPPKKQPRNVVRVQAAPGDNPDAATARALTKPETQAAVALTLFQGENYEVNSLIAELERQTSKVHSGDLSRAESMLVSQAHTLEEVFSAFVRRAQVNFAGSYFDAGERYMRLALKAQSQCRATLESLAEIKNPRPVAFVRQANITSGPQQINNGQSPSREESLIQSNELSGVQALELPQNAGAARTPATANTTLEALATVHRPQDSGRES